MSERLKPGQTLVVGSKIYMVCSQCRRIVRINKSIFGDLHLCDP